MKKNLLIINKAQFGYHTDYYKFCEYLKDEFNITYLCFDTNKEKLKMDDVKVLYVSSKGSKISRGWRFILYSLIKSVKFKGVIFINYFEKCTFLKKVLPWKKMILDIRTLSVNKNKEIRIRQDNVIKKATKLFDFTTVISEGVQQKLNLDKKKSSILPLGSDVFSDKNKLFDKEINILYVGTLNSRNINHTIIGLSYFMKNTFNPPKIHYHIVGDGFELKELKELTLKLHLENIIKFYGRIPHFKLNSFFDDCNIGISYVPMTDYYEYQPVTKTYEYILSGMPCLATNTYENRKIITEDNGILCNDNPVDFAKALEKLIGNFGKYNSEIIRNSLSEFTWKNIVNKYLLPVLNDTH